MVTNPVDQQDVSWREAWDRLLRFRDRVAAHANDTRFSDLSYDPARTDDLDAFFIFAWHFAEWLEADSTIDASKLSPTPHEFRGSS